MPQGSFGIVKCLGCDQRIIVSFKGDQKMVKCLRCGVRCGLRSYTYPKHRLTPDVAKRWPLLLKTSGNLDELRKDIPEYQPYVGTSKPFWCYISPNNPARAGDSGMPVQGEALGNVKVGASPTSVGNARGAEIQNDPRRKSQEVPLGDGVAVQESASRDESTRGVMRERSAPDRGQGGLSGGERKSVGVLMLPPQVNKGRDREQVSRGNQRMGQDRRG